MRNDAKPMFCKARPVPYALKPKVMEEIENLENMGILQNVETSEWATPIVAVPKKNGKVRICGDFKDTVIPQLKSINIYYQKSRIFLLRYLEGNISPRST